MAPFRNAGKRLSSQLWNLPEQVLLPLLNRLEVIPPFGCQVIFLVPRSSFESAYDILISTPS